MGIFRQHAPVQAVPVSVQEKLEQLESELQTAQQQIANLLDLVEKQQTRLNTQETSIARLDRIVMDILTSRAWRGLRLAGEVA